MITTILMGIDGVLAKGSTRKLDDESYGKDPHDDENWLSFLDNACEDEPIEEMIKLNNLLAASRKVIILTSRSENCRGMTIAWLNKHDVKFHALIMRPASDLRDSWEWKAEAIGKLRAEGYQLLLAFEANETNVKMLRETGICALHIKRRSAFYE